MADAALDFCNPLARSLVNGSRQRGIQQKHKDAGVKENHYGVVSLSGRISASAAHGSAMARQPFPWTA